MLIKHKSPFASTRRKAQRDLNIGKGFTWEGVAFQTRPTDLTLIAGRATKIAAKKALDESIEDFYWRAEDNTMVLFTADEFLRFAIAVDEFVESKYVESWK